MGCTSVLDSLRGVGRQAPNFEAKLGPMDGALPQGPTYKDCPMGLWEAWGPRVLCTSVLTFLFRFSSLNPLNFHGSFPKHLGSLVPSVSYRFNSKHNPNTQIKTTLDIQ